MILSIIIPCYNKKKEIRRTLDSVVSQFTEHCELIVLDDASVDGSDTEIAEWFGQVRSTTQVRVLRSKKNRGVAQIRNLGLRLARGEYIHFLDGDDCFFDGYVSNLIGILREFQPDLISSQGQWRHSQKIRPQPGIYRGLLKKTSRPNLNWVGSPYEMMGCYLALGGSQVAFRKESCGNVRAKQGENLFEDFCFYFSWIKDESKWLYWEQVGILYEDLPQESLSRKSLSLSQVALPAAISLAPTKKIQRYLAGVWIYSMGTRLPPFMALQILFRYRKSVWTGLATKYGLAGVFRIIKSGVSLS